MYLIYVISFSCLFVLFVSFFVIVPFLTHVLQHISDHHAGQLLRSLSGWDGVVTEHGMSFFFLFLGGFFFLFAVLFACFILFLSFFFLCI
jgi:hypothetical protein